MKVSLLLLVLGICTVSAANLSSQNSLLSLSVSNQPISEIIKEIEQNSDYRFILSDNIGKEIEQKISLSSNEKELNDILDEMFKGSRLTYQVLDKQVVIYRDNDKKIATIDTPKRVSAPQQEKRKISGIVSDKSGEPILGATILVEETTIGTVTDFDGNFTLEIPENATLQISYIGYKTVQLNPQGKDNFSIVLEENTEMLGDVIVIGYGRIKKEDATGAVLAIKPDEMNKGSQVTAQDALIGKIPGVSIIPGSGAPGDGGTIRIRSGSSLSASNDPLIVVDGVPIDNSTTEGSTNILSTINPNDIETFTVLKDASSTAIYGSRASNGVIIITTKKGSSGSKVKLNYNNNFTVGTVNKKVDVLSGNELRAFIQERQGSTADLGTANTRWQDEIYRTSFSNEHNFSAAGNVKEMPYRVSLGYTNQNGIIINNNYERFTGGLAFTPSFFDKHLSFNINLKGSYEKNRDAQGGVVSNAVRFDPTRPVHEENDGGYGLGYFTWLSGGAPLTIAASNPVADLELRKSVAKIKRSIGNVAADYKVHGFEDLRFNLNLGYDILESDGNENVPDKAPLTYVDFKKDGQGIDRTYTQKKTNKLLDFYANYNKEIDIHTIDVMAGYGWQHFWSKKSDRRMNHQGEELFVPTQYESEYYLLSFFGRVNYSIDSKYLFTGTLRADASSRFSKDNRWGYFPSAAFAWRTIGEGFMQDFDLFSDLKVRLSYGKTGQQDIGSDYPYLNTFTASYDNARYQFGDNWYTTYRANGYDPNIRWETTETYNVGVDYGFLNGRINGSIDGYYRKTNDLLNVIPVAAGSNMAMEIYTNIGSMKNTGFEVALNTIPVVTKNLSWDFNINMTYNKSEITKLNTIDSDSYGVDVGPISGTGKYVQTHAVGYAPYTFFLAEQAYDENGKPLEGQYVQADGSVSGNEYRRRTKSPQPKVYMGISSKVTYKEWDLGFNAHASFGNYIYNAIEADAYKESAYEGNTFSNLLRATYEKGFEKQRLYSDYFLENGSFFRMDNITLGYTFPKLGNTGMNLRVSAAVQNVFIITGYSGLDPEAFYRHDNVTYAGIDKNLYPRPRTYMVGFNLNF